MWQVTKYNVETGRPTPLAPLPGTGMGWHACYTDNIFVYVSGGSTGPRRAGVWRYNPVGDEWTALPDLAVATHGHAMVQLNGELTVVGGSDWKSVQVFRGGAWHHHKGVLAEPFDQGGAVLLNN